MALIDQLLSVIILNDGSDLHLISGQPAKMRLNGEITTVTDEQMPEAQLMELLKEICTESQWESFEKNKDLLFAYEVPEEGRFRCSYFYSNYGLAAVFRKIPLEPYSIENLNLPDSLRKICEYESGLVCITGASGCGKSTTTAAIINFINSNHSKQIVTVESPIEFIHKNKNSIICQREIGTDTDSYANALKNLMTSDTDIIYIGDVSSNETLELALKCASMGFLVFINLNSLNSVKTIETIINRFPNDRRPLIRALLAESLRAVVSQALCKKLDNERIAAFEVLLWEDTIPNTIRNDQLNNIKSIIDSNRNMGMLLLDANLNQLTNESVISPKEAYMKAIDKKLFIKYVQEDE